MSTKSTTKKFNLPDYVSIPYFLYQDDRLEKAATTIASFIYSLHTSGKPIKASKEYFCQLARIEKSRYYVILNQLENLGYISRTGFTNRRKIKWIYCPISEIIVDESDNNTEQCTCEQESNTSPVSGTSLTDKNETLVQHPGLVFGTKMKHYSSMLDTDIKDSSKDTTTSTQYFSSSISPSEASPLDLASIFEQEFPDNPKALLNKANGSFEKETLKTIKKFKEWWAAETGKSLTGERFRHYLKAMKENAPGFCHNKHPKSGRKNGFKQFINWENALKLMSGEIY